MGDRDHTDGFVDTEIIIGGAFSDEETRTPGEGDAELYITGRLLTDVFQESNKLQVGIEGTLNSGLEATGADGDIGAVIKANIATLADKVQLNSLAFAGTNISTDNNGALETRGYVGGGVQIDYDLDSNNVFDSIGFEAGIKSYAPEKGMDERENVATAGFKINF